MDVRVGHVKVALIDGRDEKVVRVGKLHHARMLLLVVGLVRMIDRVDRVRKVDMIQLTGVVDQRGGGDRRGVLLLLFDGRRFDTRRVEAAAVETLLQSEF